MISTYKMLADHGLPNNAQITDQASTLSQNTLVLFDMNEGHPVTVVTDVIGGALKIDNNTTDVTVENGGPGPGSVRILAIQTATLTGGNWPNLGADDFMLLVAGQSVDGGASAEDNGHLSFYYGDNGGVTPTLQPYYAVFTKGVSLPFTISRLTTPADDALTKRTIGENYMFVYIKRGDWMEHYAKVGTADAYMTGKVNVTTHSNGFLADEWANLSNAGGDYRTGHSGAGSQNMCTQDDVDNNYCEYVNQPFPGSFSSAKTNKEQDFYIKMVQTFPNGSPVQSEIEHGMDWMMSRALNADKVIYPGWMF